MGRSVGGGLLFGTIVSAALVWNNMQSIPDLGRRLAGVSLFLAPLFYFASDFFWIRDGQYGVTTGVLLVIGSIFWILALQEVFAIFRQRRPLYSALGFLLAVYGCVCGGVAFGLQGFFNEIYGISKASSLQALASWPVAANVIFWTGGPAFPLSLLLLGIMLVRERAVPVWTGLLLSIGGALFPVARIARLESMAHFVALLLLIPMSYLAVKVLQMKINADSQSGTGPSRLKAGL